MLIYTDKQWIVQVNWDNYPTKKKTILVLPDTIKIGENILPSGILIWRGIPL